MESVILKIIEYNVVKGLYKILHIGLIPNPPLINIVFQVFHHLHPAFPLQKPTIKIAPHPLHLLLLPHLHNQTNNPHKLSYNIPI
jgi:hypothetical protein